MFGLNLQQFIEDNVTFTNAGGCRPNQDIYYNIEDDKFWIHLYCGNESLSPDDQKENILICEIHNTEEFHMICKSCEGYDGEWEYDCPQWQECQAESLYEYIRDDCYNPQNIIYEQIVDRIDNCHYEELAEIDLLLEYEYGQYHEFVNKSFNSRLAIDLKDQIIDNALEYGFDDGIDDSWLNEDCMNLVIKYEHIDDKKLRSVLNLLGKYKIPEALELLKE